MCMKPRVETRQCPFQKVKSMAFMSFPLRLLWSTKIKVQGHISWDWDWEASLLVKVTKRDIQNNVIPLQI